MTQQAERGSLAEIEASAEYNLGVTQDELDFVIRRVRHFIRLTEEMLQYAQGALAESYARMRPAEPKPDEQAEAARDAMAEKVRDAQEMLAEMRTDDDGEEV